jgi:hypothetical protein
MTSSVMEKSASGHVLVPLKTSWSILGSSVGQVRLSKGKIPEPPPNHQQNLAGFQFHFGTA